MTKGEIPGTLEGLFREEDELRRLESEIRERRERVAEARRVLNELTPAHHLAIQLHEKFCRWNHTDGCGWHYFVKDGQHDWTEHAHQDYLRRAVAIMRRLERGPITCDNVTDFIRTL